MTATKSPSVVPSLLAGDLSQLGRQLDAVKAAGCTWVSVDVMDGHFVPNLSFGPDFVKLCKSKGFVVDTHLMVTNPLDVAKWFVDMGSDFVTLHIETVQDPVAALKAIRALGVKNGLAVKPKTPVDGLLAALPHCDLALVMTVEPGFGGQSFLDICLPKIRRARQAISASGLDVWLQVDGGVSAQTIERAADAGADVFVAGSAVYGADDAAARISELRELAGRHAHP